jgi:hypothetical protein
MPVKSNSVTTDNKVANLMVVEQLNKLSEVAVHGLIAHGDDRERSVPRPLFLQIPIALTKSETL